MNDLLFYTLLIALAYYFMIYTKPTNRPDPTFKHSSTQTDQPFTEYEPGPTLNCPGPQFIPDPETIKNLQEQITALTQDQAQKARTIQGLNASYEKLSNKKEQQITTLNQQITNLKSQLTALQSTQTSDQKELEKTLDQLIKGMTDLEKEL
jgi:DNA repair exonuclease SbcCD ATPase subunit